MNIARAETLKLMIFGDSLVAGFGLKPDEAYPKVLEKNLHAQGYDNIKTINAGVSGDTTSGGLMRLKWSLDMHKPDLFILELGANDMLRATPTKLTKSNLRAMLEILVNQYKIPTLVMGMYADPALGEHFIKDYEEMYKSLAEEYKVDLYPFFLEGVIEKRPYLLPDGIHPNDEGVKVIVENTLPYVTSFIESAK